MIIRQTIFEKVRYCLTLLALFTSVVSLWLVYSLHSNDNRVSGDHVVPRNARIDEATKLSIALRELRKADRPRDSAFNFNVTGSDGIALDRAIPDTRPDVCKLRRYKISELQTVSIVIPFYNEAWSTLLRTIHAILKRTPKELLKEIILVDDASEYEYLGKVLEGYLSILTDKVRVVRNRRRQGLIKSRMNGFELSTGEIITFLDAHTEVNIGWYEPLASKLRLTPKAILQSFVDGINRNTMIYSKPEDIHKGGFTWDLRYVWIRVPDHQQQDVMDRGDSYTSITLVGCVITATAEYFKQLGGFDRGMRVWGGENIELAFKAWMCGGSVETITCSRVGHMFRSIPYQKEISNNQIWQRNLMRIADVWMGDYKKYFYSSTMIYKRNRIKSSADDIASLSEQFALKSRLNCRSFEWFLSQVSMEIVRPSRDAIYHGEILNLQTKGCWSVMSNDYIDINQICYEHKLMPENEFTMTSGGLLLHRERCVYHDYPSPNLRLTTCPATPGELVKFGRWSMRYVDSRWGEIRLTRSQRTEDYCVQHATSVVQPYVGRQMAQTSHCTQQSEQDNFQMWSFTYRFDFNASEYYMN